jgi:hypothetical protein
MGDLWPQALPGAEDADYGTVTLEPRGAFVARSFQTFTLTYTVGAFGLDDTGAIKIVQRWTNDGGPLQIGDPAAMNYVTATASNGVTLDIAVETYPHQRPWYDGLRITVRRGYMRQGDTITIVYGDRSGGSPGLRLQSFCETAFEFKTLADPCATGVFIPVASPHIEIVAGPPVNWTLTAPTLRRPGDPFSLGIRAEDLWGNATGDYSGTLEITADRPVDGLPLSLPFPTGQRGVTVPDLVAHDGPVRFTLSLEGGTKRTISNPMVVQNGHFAAFWGDLHGQSGETVGINPVTEYFEFARDVAFLDVTSHQANDFHLKNAFWDHLNTVCADFNEDGRFTVFPGYEWSANTPLGGDHNVFFRNENRQIVRSSHSLLEDRSDLSAGAHDLPQLFSALQQEDCILFAHVGGRPADISRAEDARLRTSVEVHSDWGTFEWILTDAFSMGYRVGVVANSDGHKGAPGACYPGASEFGAYSGLTCYLAPDLTRDAIFDCLRARHHYGTTGARIHLEVTADLGTSGAIFPVDPRISNAPPKPAHSAMMGDIVSVQGAEINVEISVETTSPILGIDVFSGPDLIETHRPYSDEDLGNRMRVIFQGAEYRGRGRQSYWQGDIRVEGAKIAAFRRFNHWNHDRPFDQTGDDAVRFDVVTTGNHAGCDLWLDAPGTVRVACDLARADSPLHGMSAHPLRIDAGGLDRNITLQRLPDRLTCQSMQVNTAVSLRQNGDTPIWVRVKTEDGHTAWSSPIYALPVQPV